jgi:hypothetical protein
MMEWMSRILVGEMAGADELGCKFRWNSGRNFRSGGNRGYFSRNVVPGLLIFRKKNRS